MKETKKENDIFTIDKEVKLVSAHRRSDLNNNDQISISIDDEKATTAKEPAKTTADSLEIKEKKDAFSIRSLFCCCCSKKTGGKDGDKKVSPKAEIFNLSLTIENTKIE